MRLPLVDLHQRDFQIKRQVAKSNMPASFVENSTDSSMVHIEIGTYFYK